MAKIANFKLNTIITASDKASSVFSRHADAVSSADKAARRAQSRRIQELQSATRTVDFVAGKMNSIGNKAALITAGVAAKVSYDVMGVGYEYEKQMSLVASRVNEATFARGTESFAAMEQSVANMAVHLGEMPADVAKMYNSMAGAGMDDAAMKMNAKVFGQFSKLGGMDMATGTDQAMQMVKGLTGADVNSLEYAGTTQKVLDQLQLVNQKTVATLPQLARGLSILGPISKGLNVPMEQSIALLGTLHEAGITGAKAGTGIGSIMTSLSSPFGRTKEALKDIGVDMKKFYSISDDGKTYVKDFVGLLGEIGDKTKDMEFGPTGDKKFDALATALGFDPTDRENEMGALFGKHHAKTAWALDSAGTEQIRKMTEDLKNAAGFNDEAFKHLQSGTDYTIDQAKAMVALEEIKMFKELGPVIREVAPMIAEMFKDLAAFVKEHKGEIKSFTVFIVKWGPSLLGVGLALKALAIPTKLMSDAFKMKTYIEQMRMAGSASGIGGIGGLGKALTGLSAGNLITAKLTGGAAVAAGAGVASILMAGAVAWGYTITTLVTRWDDVVEGFKLVASDFVSWIGTKWDEIGATLKTKWTEFTTWFKGSMPSIDIKMPAWISEWMNSKDGVEGGGDFNSEGMPSKGYAGTIGGQVEVALQLSKNLQGPKRQVIPVTGAAQFSSGGAAT